MNHVTAQNNVTSIRVAALELLALFLEWQLEGSLPAGALDLRPQERATRLFERYATDRKAKTGKVCRAVLTTLGLLVQLLGPGGLWRRFLDVCK